MRRFPSTRWIPKDSTPVTRDGVDAIVYCHVSCAKPYRPAAIAYHGKATKADWNYAFVSDIAREKKINEFFDNIQGHQQRIAQEKSERANWQHGFKIGDILHYSWGYDQTNAEFYQVTEVKDKTIIIREIASRSVPGSEGFMSESLVAVSNKFLEKKGPLTKHPQPQKDGPGYVRMDYGSASLWRGQPCYSSWYA